MKAEHLCLCWSGATGCVIQRVFLQEPSCGRIVMAGAVIVETALGIILAARKPVRLIDDSRTSGRTKPGYSCKSMFTKRLRCGILLN